MHLTGEETEKQLGSAQSIRTTNSAPENRRFLEILFGRVHQGFILVTVDREKKRKLDSGCYSWSFPVADLDAAAGRIATETSLGKDVWFRAVVAKERVRWNQRGLADNSSTITALWWDLDIDEPNAHKRPDLLPKTLDAALSFLSDLPDDLQPSMIVDSGHGLHVYWLLSEPWHLNSDAEVRKADALVRNFQYALNHYALAESDWAIDPPDSLAKILRPAGSVNFKPNCEPLPVQILEYHPERLHNLEYLEAASQAIEIMSDLKKPTKRSAGEKTTYASNFEPPLWKGDRPLFSLLLERCKVARKGMDDPNSILYPVWARMLTNIIPCEDGIKHAHEWSAKHTRYSPEETDGVVHHWMGKGKGYFVSCENIAANGGAIYCDGCKYRQLGKNPALVALRHRQPL